MSKVRNFAEITPNLPFTEYDFYALYRVTFENTELGRMKKVLPLHEMARNFGFTHESLQPKRGRKSYFTPEGKVAVMFLKMYTGLSFPKLLEQLNANVHFQIFCDISARCTAMEGSFGTQKETTRCAGLRQERRLRKSCTYSSASILPTLCSWQAGYRICS